MPIPGKRKPSEERESQKPNATGRAVRHKKSTKNGDRILTLDHLIRSHPFWEGLDSRHFQILHECAALVKFGVNEPIFHAGVDADFFYLICTGRVALETFVPGKGALTIETLAAGEALGWSWLFSPYRWHFSAHSIELTEAVAFRAHRLRIRVVEDHDFGYELTTRVCRVVCQRLLASRLQLMEFYVAGD